MPHPGMGKWGNQEGGEQTGPRNELRLAARRAGSSVFHRLDGGDEQSRQMGLVLPAIVDDHSRALRRHTDVVGMLDGEPPSVIHPHHKRSEWRGPRELLDRLSEHGCTMAIGGLWSRRRIQARKLAFQIPEFLISRLARDWQRIWNVGSQEESGTLPVFQPSTFKIGEGGQQERGATRPSRGQHRR